MKIEIVDPRQLKFLLQVSHNPSCYEPFEEMVMTLEEQEVLSIFICPETLDQLISLIEENVPDFFAPISAETYNQAFIPSFLREVAVKVFDNKKENSTIEDVELAIENFINEPNWFRIFEIIWGTSYMLQKFCFEPAVFKWKQLPNVTEAEITQITALLSQTFSIYPISNFPNVSWIKEHVWLREGVSIKLYLDEKFMDEAFIAVEKLYQKRITHNAIETVKLRATFDTEMFILYQIMKEFSQDKKITVKNITEYSVKLKDVKPIYLKAIYYIFLLHSFHSYIK